MKYHLKEHYGRRITPGVRIFILVAIILLGLHLAFGAASHGEKKQTYNEMVK